MKIIPQEETRYTEVELPPGIHQIAGTIRKNTYNGEFHREDRYLVESTEPFSVWERQLRYNNSRGYGEWQSLGYVIPSWWTRLWNKPYRGAVPHAKVVTR